MIQNGWERTSEEQALIDDVRRIKQSDIPNLNSKVERLAKAVEQLSTSLAQCNTSIVQLKTSMTHVQGSLCDHDSMLQEIVTINERLGKLKDNLYNISDF